MPALTLVLGTTASFVLVTRGGIRAVRSEPYVGVARAKGLSERRLALTHALPNAALPLLSLLGVRVGQVLGLEVSRLAFCSSDWPGCLRSAR